MAKYIRNNAGTLTETPAISTSAGVGDANKIVETNGTGKLDITLMPTGIGAETSTILASENLAAGDLVEVFNNAGTANVRKADASNGRLAKGFVLAPVTTGNNATVYFEGGVTGLTGLIPGTKLFLSAAVAGTVAAVAPTVAGQTVQQVGYATSTTSFTFSPQLDFLLG